jgi:hypothetical protein
MMYFQIWKQCREDMSREVEQDRPANALRDSRERRGAPGIGPVVGAEEGHRPFPQTLEIPEESRPRTQEAMIVMNISRPNRADMNISAPSKRSPLVFFILIFALSVPLWVIGSFIEVDGLPKNAQVTEFGLAFTPLAAASILVYGEEGIVGVGRLLKRIFDYRRIKLKLWYVPIIFLMPFI